MPGSLIKLQQQSKDAKTQVHEAQAQIYRQVSKPATDVLQANWHQLL